MIVKKIIMITIMIMIKNNSNNNAYTKNRGRIEGQQ